jgi:hypothetical protein
MYRYCERKDGQRALRPGVRVLEPPFCRPDPTTNFCSNRHPRACQLSISISLNFQEASPLLHLVENSHTNLGSLLRITPPDFSPLTLRGPMPIQLMLFRAITALGPQSSSFFLQHEYNHELGVPVVRTAPLLLIRYGHLLWPWKPMAARTETITSVCGGCSDLIKP